MNFNLRDKFSKLVFIPGDKNTCGTLDILYAVCARIAVYLAVSLSERVFDLLISIFRYEH